MPMNPVVKARWGQWLLEHEDQQGTETLRRDTPEGPRFCCLGGLCELAVADGIVQLRPWTDGDGRRHYGHGEGDGDGGSSILPASVASWAGLPDTDPAVTVRGELFRLSVLNDTGTTFRGAWALIEEQL